MPSIGWYTLTHSISAAYWQKTEWWYGDSQLTVVFAVWRISKIGLIFHQPLRQILVTRRVLFGITSRDFATSTLHHSSARFHSYATPDASEVTDKWHPKGSLHDRWLRLHGHRWAAKSFVPRKKEGIRWVLSVKCGVQVTTTWSEGVHKIRKWTVVRALLTGSCMPIARVRINKTTKVDRLIHLARLAV